MAPTNPTDHELNEVLARVVGVELHESEKGWMYWYNFGHGESLQVWNPLHDANQMERVKKSLGLRSYTITRSRGKSHVQINNDHPQMGSPNVWIAEHPDELRAFAQAVAACWNERKKEKAT